MLYVGGCDKCAKHVDVVFCLHDKDGLLIQAGENGFVQWEVDRTAKRTIQRVKSALLDGAPALSVSATVPIRPSSDTAPSRYPVERFHALVEEFHQQEIRLSGLDKGLGVKGGQYASEQDRLRNFREVAEFEGRRPAEVALTYLLKHVQSIAHFVRSGKQQPGSWAWEDGGAEGRKQKIADARNYLLLLAACLDEEAATCSADKK